MPARSKLLAAGLAAAFLLSLAVTAASGNKLSLSNGNIRVRWSPLTLDNVNVGPIECPLTMEGSFHSATMSKVEGALVGHISKASVANGACTGGHATVLLEHLPWHVRYGGFTGTLPSIAGVIVNIVGAAVLGEKNGVTCPVQTTSAHPARFILDTLGGVVTGMRADETAGIPLSGGFICEIAGESFLARTGTVTLLGNTIPITITLI